MSFDRCVTLSFDIKAMKLTVFNVLFFFFFISYLLSYVGFENFKCCGGGRVFIVPGVWSEDLYNNLIIN